MLAGLLFLIPASFFVYGVVRDRRRLSNAIWLGITLVMLLLLLADAGQDNPVISLPLLLAFVLAVLGLLLLPLALLANGLVMVRREGRSLANLLSLLAGLALIGEMIYFFWGISRPSDWIRGSAIGLFLVSAYIAFLFVSLLLYSVIYGRTGRRSGFDGIVVLGAMIARIGDLGFSPNRTAALGLNLVLLVNLAGAGYLSARFVTRRSTLHRLERWQTSYLPVFAAWAAAVVVILPPLFGWS